VAAIVGETEEHRLEKFEAMRAQQVAFVLARQLLDRYFRAPDADGQPGAEQPWLFPRVIQITKGLDRWVRHPQGRRVHRPARLDLVLTVGARW